MQIIHYRVDPSHEQAFLAAIAKGHMALQECGFEPHYSWIREIGGEGPTYTLVLPMNSWAEMAEPDRPLPQVLEEVLGRFEAEELMSTFADAVVSTELDRAYATGFELLWAVVGADFTPLWLRQVCRPSRLSCASASLDSAEGQRLFHIGSGVLVRRVRFVSVWLRLAGLGSRFPKGFPSIVWTVW